MSDENEVTKIYVGSDQKIFDQLDAEMQAASIQQTCQLCEGPAWFSSPSEKEAVAAPGKGIGIICFRCMLAQAPNAHFSEVVLPEADREQLIKRGVDPEKLISDASKMPIREFNI